MGGEATATGCGGVGGGCGMSGAGRIIGIRGEFCTDVCASCWGCESTDVVDVAERVALVLPDANFTSGGVGRCGVAAGIACSGEVAVRAGSRGGTILGIVHNC